MAIFYPTQPPEKSPNSELKVRKALLSNTEIIGFHSVGWQSRRNNKQGDGEADFILLIPGRGLLILEVKGGGVEIENGIWYSTGADRIQHKIKDPFEQAKDSKFALLAFFQNTKPRLGLIPIFHGVCFPDITISGGLSTLGPRELILDRGDLLNLAESLERIGRHWKVSHTFSSNEVQDIISLLAPTTIIRRTLRDAIADADHTLIKLTQQQINIFRSLGRNKRAIIMGGAGSGKTILAIEKARQVSSLGLRTLLICFNGPLKEFISKTMQGTLVDVESFHSLVVREAKKAKINLPTQLNQEWFDSRAVGDLLDSLELNQTKYDAVIVDEAQDFSKDWIESILFLTKDSNSLVYLFADSHQDLYARGLIFPDNFAQFELTINCRNTNPIAKKVCGIFSDEFSKSDAEGPEPVFIEVTRQEQFVRHIIRLLESLIFSEGLKPEQIVVLSDSTRILEELKTTGVGEHLFAALHEHGIPVETISRFKGLERDLVILAMTNAVLERDFKRIAYVGLSRAKSGLYILGSQQVRKAFLWA